MKSHELKKLKQALLEEKEKRELYNRLLASPDVQEYIKMKQIEDHPLSVENIWEMLEEILKNFTFSETNKILVYIRNCITDCDIYYQDTNYFTRDINLDRQDGEFKIFRNIESGKNIKVYTDKYIASLVAQENEYYSDSEQPQTIEDYCIKHRYTLESKLEELGYVVINPHRYSDSLNGYKEVRKDFFLEAVTHGQTAAKKLILTKYH